MANLKDNEKKMSNTITNLFETVNKVSKTKCPSFDDIEELGKNLNSVQMLIINDPKNKVAQSIIKTVGGINRDFTSLSDDTLLAMAHELKEQTLEAA